jgi:hypothetical protein
MTGVRAMRVDAIPVLVCWIAMRENDTPKKGPKIEPIKMLFMATLS